MPTLHTRFTLSGALGLGALRRRQARLGAGPPSRTGACARTHRSRQPLAIHVSTRNPMTAVLA